MCVCSFRFGCAEPESSTLSGWCHHHAHVHNHDALQPESWWRHSGNVNNGLLLVPLLLILDYLKSFRFPEKTSLPCTVFHNEAATMEELLTFIVNVPRVPPGPSQTCPLGQNKWSDRYYGLAGCIWFGEASSWSLPLGLCFLAALSSPLPLSHMENQMLVFAALLKTPPLSRL